MQAADEDTSRPVPEARAVSSDVDEAGAHLDAGDVPGVGIDGEAVRQCSSCGSAITVKSITGLCKGCAVAANNRARAKAAGLPPPIKSDAALVVVTQPPPPPDAGALDLIGDLRRISKATGKPARMVLEVLPDGTVRVTDVSI